MTKDDALKMALEALEDVDGIDTETECVTIDVGEVITAIQEALTQPEQEPVAWLHNGKLHEVDPIDWATGTVTPLYTSPQPRKPWVNPSLKEYEEIILANMTPKNLDEREAVIGALNDMVVLLEEKNK